MYLSGVIITKNASLTLNRCLVSLSKVADEIIIIDSGSKDNTLDIANQFGCKIIKTDWLGYGKTKNIGHQAANYPYIISLDSDEELSEELVDEILSIKEKLTNVYSFKRLNNFCGKWIKHGSWYPDVKIRIFPKIFLWDHAHSHEQLIILSKTKVNSLNGLLLHYAYQNIDQLKYKTQLYSQLGAQQKRNKNNFELVLKLMFSPTVGFCKSYFFKLGIFDGYYGLIISYFNAKGTFCKYLQALKLTKNKL
jgi:glycosyltransferase involved in cell wall biosynthesis